MKKLCIALFAIAMAAPAFSATKVWQDTGHGIKANLGSIDVKIEFYTPASARVVKTPAGKNVTEKSYSVIASPENVAKEIRQKGNIVEVKTSQMTAVLNLASGEVKFISPKGKVLLREKGNALLSPMDDAGTPSLRVRQEFVLDKDEAIYGLGNLENGRLSQRGVTRTLMPGNVEDGIPVIQSSKGYGIIWDNYSPTLFADSPVSTAFESEVGEGVDYYFINGNDSDGVTKQIRKLTGDVPMFPLWTYGFWQSRERYKTQQEIVDVVKRHRELGVPLDGIIQDWQYWGNNYMWNAMEFMSPDFPNPQAMSELTDGGWIPQNLTILT